MYIIPCESELLGVEIIPVDINECYDETLGLEIGLFMNRLDIGFKINIFENGWIEMGLIGLIGLVLFYELFEQGCGQIYILLELIIGWGLIMGGWLCIWWFRFNFKWCLFLHYII